MSDLLKMKRLVDGDDLFRWRVEAACWKEGVEMTEPLLRRVAADPDILRDAVLEPPDTIKSDGVTDEEILKAVQEALAAERNRDG